MDDNARILAEIAQRMAALPEEEQRRILDELQRRLKRAAASTGTGCASVIRTTGARWRSKKC